MTTLDIVYYICPRAKHPYARSKAICAAMDPYWPTTDGNVRTWLKKAAKDPDSEPPRGWQYAFEVMSGGELKARRGK